MSTQEQTTAKRKPGLGAIVKRILNGEFLSTEEMIGQLPFLLFLVVLFLCNIAWIYSFENTERALQEVNRELEQKQAEYNTTVSKLETLKRQSNMAEDMQTIGLKVPTVPPFIIEADSDFMESE